MARSVVPRPARSPAGRAVRIPVRPIERALLVPSAVRVVVGVPVGVPATAAAVVVRPRRIDAVPGMSRSESRADEGGAGFVVVVDSEGYTGEKGTGPDGNGEVRLTRCSDGPEARESCQNQYRSACATHCVLLRWNLHAQGAGAVPIPAVLSKHHTHKLLPCSPHVSCHCRACPAHGTQTSR